MFNIVDLKRYRSLHRYMARSTIFLPSSVVRRCSQIQRRTIRFLDGFYLTLLIFGRCHILGSPLVVFVFSDFHSVVDARLYMHGVTPRQNEHLYLAGTV